jgi:hypothetical protein
VQKGWDTRVNGVGELVEDEAGQGEKDGFEVKVEEVDVNFRRWGCGGHGVPVRTADAELSTLMNWICACGGVVPLKGIGKRKCLSVNFCFALGQTLQATTMILAVACAEAITSVGVGRS